MTIDIATNALMQSIENPILTSFSKIIAHALDPIVLIIISLIIATFVYRKISKRKGIFFAAIILITGALIKLSKEIFQRIRPLNSLVSETSFSMPSGHVTIAVVFFGLITFLFTNTKHKKIALATTSLIALIVGFTRIYLRVHWLTDVLAGFALGAIILTIAIITFKKFS